MSLWIFVIPPQLLLLLLIFINFRESVSIIGGRALQKQFEQDKRPL